MSAVLHVKSPAPRDTVSRYLHPGTSLVCLFRRLKILTIEELLDGKQMEYSTLPTYEPLLQPPITSHLIATVGLYIKR